MKKIITLLLFTCFLGQVYAQNEPKTLIQRTLDSLNPLGHLGKISTGSKAKSDLAGPSLDFSPSKTGSLIGADWQSEVLNGVTDFLIQRAKDEVLASLLTDLKKFFNLENDKNSRMNQEMVKIMSTTFPNVAKLVNDIVVYDKNVLMLLQQAFKEDFSSQLPKALSVQMCKYLKSIELDTSEIKLSQYMIVKMLEILKGSNPYLVLAGMKKDLPKIANDTMNIGLYILGTLASEQYYVNNFQGKIQDLSSFLSSSENFLKFSQLLEDDYKKRFGSVKINRYAILELSKGLKTLGEDLKNLSYLQDSEYRIGYIKMLNSIQLILRELADLDSTFKGKWVETLIGVDKFINVQKSIIARDYRKAVLEFSSLLDGSILDSKTVRFLSFAATMAEVKSSEEVVAAIESFASPIGSFRTKRIEERPRAYSTINAYVGYAAGREWLIDKTVANSRLAAGYHGYYTPVGFEFGTAWKKKVVSSFGLFISPIDLGTMTSYRMGQNSWDSLTVNNQEKINFRSVLAPSAALVFGLSKTKPVTLAVGYQFSPEQRVLSNTVLNTNANVNVHRLFATLSIDLTLLRL